LHISLFFKIFKSQSRFCRIHCYFFFLKDEKWYNWYPSFQTLMQCKIFKLNSHSGNLTLSQKSLAHITFYIYFKWHVKFNVKLKFSPLSWFVLFRIFRLCDAKYLSITYLHLTLLGEFIYCAKKYCNEFVVVVALKSPSRYW
jgi:hypothetical protein